MYFGRPLPWGVVAERSVGVLVGAARTHAGEVGEEVAVGEVLDDQMVVRHV
jgi:hypothetical protein